MAPTHQTLEGGTPTTRTKAHAGARRSCFCGTLRQANLANGDVVLVKHVAGVLAFGFVIVNVAVGNRLKKNWAAAESETGGAGVHRTRMTTITLSKRAGVQGWPGGFFAAPHWSFRER